MSRNDSIFLARSVPHRIAKGAVSAFKVGRYSVAVRLLRSVLRVDHRTAGRVLGTLVRMDAAYSRTERPA